MMLSRRHFFTLLFGLWAALLALPAQGIPATDGRVVKHLAAGKILATGGDFNTVTVSGKKFHRVGLVLTDLASGAVIENTCLDTDGGSITDLAWDGDHIVWGSGNFQSVCGLVTPHLVAIDLRTGRPFRWTRQYPDADTDHVLWDPKLRRLYTSGQFLRIGNSFRWFLGAYDEGGGVLPWAPVTSGPPTSIATDPRTGMFYAGGTAITNGQWRGGATEISPYGEGEVTDWAPDIEDPSADAYSLVIPPSKSVSMLIGNITPRLQDDGQAVVVVRLTDGTLVTGRGSYHFAGTGRDAKLLPDNSLLLLGELGPYDNDSALILVRVTPTGRVVKSWGASVKENNFFSSDPQPRTIAPSPRGYEMGGLFDFFDHRAAANWAVIQ